MTTVAQRIAGCLDAMTRCSAEWRDRHEETIEQLGKDALPAGCGFDDGSSVNIADSTPDRLVLETSFHHMTEGSYDGWTDHTVTVEASLVFGLKVDVSGDDRNGILDYIADLFIDALTAEAPKAIAYAD